MREGWTYKKIKDVAKVFAGQGAPQGDSNYSLDGTPFVKAGNLSDLINGESESSIQKVSKEVAQSHKLKLYKAGSVLFAKSGMSCMKGFVYTLKSDCYVVSHLAIITPHSVNSHFLNYYLRYNKPNSLIKDEAYPSISLKDIENLQIPFPPIAEQKRIVAELDLLSGIIEKKKEQLKAYDQLAQSIFYTMFGDPIDNPKGWEVKHLGEVCDFINGFAFKSDLFKNNGLPILRISNIQNNVVNEEGMVYFSPTDYREDFTKYSVNKGDIVIAMSGATTGKLGVYLGERTCYLNQRVGKFQVKSEDRITNKLLLYYLRTISKQILTDAMGVAQPNISSKQIKEYTIILPPLSLQQEFAEKVEAIERQKALVQQSIEETQTMFDYTMDKYFG